MSQWSRELEEMNDPPHHHHADPTAAYGAQGGPEMGRERKVEIGCEMKVLI